MLFKNHEFRELQQVGMACPNPQIGADLKSYQLASGEYRFRGHHVENFLSDIRAFFSAKHSGKYFSVLLRELAFQEPSTFSAVFKLSKEHKQALINGSLQVEREWHFLGSQGRRFADLVVIEGGSPILIVEVKEDDVGSHTNPAQLVDYFKFIKSHVHDIRFAHVSRYTPTVADMLEIDKAKSNGICVIPVRYRDIHAKVVSQSTPFAIMMKDYLEDIGVASYQPLTINSSSVKFFLTQALGFPHKQGLGKLHSRSAIEELPKIMRQMFSNLEAVGEWVRDANRDAFSQRFTVKYKPRPEYDLKSLRKIIPDDCNQDAAELPAQAEKYIKSGTVIFYAWGGLANAPWLGLELGICLSIEKNPKDKKKAVSASMYAAFVGGGMESYASSNVYSKFPSEETALNNFRNLISTSLDIARGEATNTNHKDALKRFVIPPKIVTLNN